MSTEYLAQVIRNVEGWCKLQATDATQKNARLCGWLRILVEEVQMIEDIRRDAAADPGAKGWMKAAYRQVATIKGLEQEIERLRNVMIESGIAPSDESHSSLKDAITRSQE